MILVAGNNTELNKQIQALYATGDCTITSIPDVSQLKQAVETYRPDVLVIGPPTPAHAAINVVSKLSAEYPEVSVVLVVPALEPALLRDAMRVGVKDVIEQGSTGDQVRASIDRALEVSQRLRQSFDIRTERTENEPEPQEGKVITFFSTKGGVGKSVISANVAVALAKSTGKRVVMLDLDLQFGDVAIIFQMVPRHTIFDAIQVMERLDEEMLQGFLASHPSGVKALLAPVRPHESDSITPTHVKEIIKLLRQFFDYVIIDTPPAFSDVILTALDESDCVYLIATMDMASIKNIKLAIQTMKQLGYPADRIKFVLNRADSKVWLEIDEVEKTLGIKADSRVPSDRVVPRSINKGTPIVIEQPKSAVAKSLFALAEKVEEVQALSENTIEQAAPSKQKVFGLIRRLP